MINIKLLLQEFVEKSEDYTLIFDTPSGINISVDSVKTKKTLWFNIIENSNISDSTSGLSCVLNRNLEIWLFKDAAKESEGDEYNVILDELRNDVIGLFGFLSKKINVSSGNIQTAVDEDDRNLAAIVLNITTEEVINYCD